MFYLVLVQFYFHFDTTSNDQNDAMATAFFLKDKMTGFIVYCHFRDITSKD